jgi:hypothetical protein
LNKIGDGDDDGEQNISCDPTCDPSVSFKKILVAKPLVISVLVTSVLVKNGRDLSTS